jgi:hypothetical protein
VNSAVRNYPRPPKRSRDPKVLRTFHASDPACVSCRERPAQAHHLLSRAQGGDDVRQNLIGLCSRCHGAYHGQPYMTRSFGSDAVRITPEIVKRRIGTWLLSEEGIESCWYLTARLGTGGSVAFLERLGAKP